MVCGYINLLELMSEKFIPDPFPRNNEDKTVGGNVPRMHCMVDHTRSLINGQFKILG